MRSTTKTLLVLFFSLSFCGIDALGQELPGIAAEEIPGFDIRRNDCFDGNSLWGYMNGGADIYLEYGFNIMRVEEFANESETLKLELYKMKDAVSAFGIYSIKTFKCLQHDLKTTPDCLNRYQYQLLSGAYYIQFISESGSEEAGQLMLDMADILLRKLPEEVFTLPARLLTDSLGVLPEDIKMVKGELGVQNIMMELSPYFTDDGGYQVFCAQIPVEGEKVKYYEIIFNDHELKDRFLEINWDATFRIVSQSSTSILIRL